jgi:DeoR/GlpR family transcriptional regulator of sugar metabolism
VSWSAPTAGALSTPHETVEDAGTTATEAGFDLATTDPDRARIASTAADLVPDGAVILCDIGTTTGLLARHLHGRDITVMTSNLAIYEELKDDEHVRLVLLGGVVRRNYQSLVGSLTEHALTQVSADLVFLSCTGVRASGHVVDNMAVEAPIKQAMIAAADQVVLLAAPAKFPGSGALKLCSLGNIDTLVTTSDAPEDSLNRCRESGGEVVLA